MPDLMDAVKDDDKLNERSMSPDTDRDKSPEREDTKQEKCRETIERTVREAGLKEGSRDVLIAGRVIESIERDNAKPAAIKEIQERCLADIMRDRSDKTPEKDSPVIKKDVNIGDAIRDLKEESFNMALREIIGGTERSDVAKNNANTLILEINSDEKTMSPCDRTAACLAVTDMLKDGRIPEKEITDDEKKELFERVKSDAAGRNLEAADRDDGRNEKSLNDRQRLERAGALERKISINAERDKNPLNAEERYRIGSAIEKIERNQIFDDKFKAAQERLISACVKDDRESVLKDGSRQAINTLIRNSEKEAFRMEMEQYREEGKISSNTAEILFNSYVADDKRSDAERSAYIKAAIDSARSGELKDVLPKDTDKTRGIVEKNAKEIISRNEYEKNLSNTLKNQGNQMLSLTKEEIPKMRDDKNQPVKSDQKEIDKAFDDIKRSSEKDFIRTEQTKNMQAVQLKMEVGMNPQRFIKDGKFSAEELTRAYRETERSVFNFKVEHSDASRMQKDNAQTIIRNISDDVNLRGERKSAAYELIMESLNRKEIPDRAIDFKELKEIEGRVISDAANRVKAIKNSSPSPEYEKRPGEISRFYASNKAPNLGDERLNDIRDAVVRHNMKSAGLSVEFVRSQNDAIKPVIDERVKNGKEVCADEIVAETKIIAFDRFVRDNEKNYKGENGEQALEFAKLIIREPEKFGLDREEKVNAAISQLMTLYKKDVSFSTDKDSGKGVSVFDVVKESRGTASNIINRMDERDKSVLNRTDKQLEKVNAPYYDGRVKEEPKKDNVPEKDDKKTEKKREERPIGTDPDKDARDESKVSKRTSGKEAKEVYEKCNEIYTRKVINSTHHTDLSLTHEERDTIERGIKLKNELMDRNNEEIAGLSRHNIELQKEGKEIPKEIIERLGKLEKFNKIIKSDIEKLNIVLHPEKLYRDSLERPAGETREELKKDLIERTIYPDPSNDKLFHFRERVIKWRLHSDVMEKSVYDSCLYSAMSGRSPSLVARQYIFASDMRNVKVSAEAMNKLFMESRHHEGARRYLELFKVEGRKVKPLEANNICTAIDMVNRGEGSERMKEYERLVIADMCRKSQIPNTKMTRDDSKKLYDKIQSLALEKSLVKDPIKEGIEREERKATMREKLSAVPEKTDREIVKLILTSKEKLDIQGLVEISRDAGKKLDEMSVTDKDGNKKPILMEEYILSKTELRQIVCGKNPDALTRLQELNVRMPKGVDLNVKEYNRALETIRKINEKNDIMKMAMVNHALSRDGSYSGLDGAEGIRMMGIKSDAEKLVKSDAKDKMEQAKDIRETLKIKTREQLAEAREEDKKKVKPFSYGGSPEKILSQVSHYVGNMCRSEDYDRQRVIEKLEEVRAGMKYQRSVFYEDFKSITTFERGLKPADAISVIQNDPRMLINIQRAGISIGRNGLMNENRLKNAIYKIEEIPKNEVVLRMAVLEKNYVSHKNNGMKITNPIDMGDRNDTKDAKNLAFYLYARDHNLKFREPVDDREKQALKHNIDLITKYEKNAAAERTMSINMRSMLTKEEADDPRTFANVSSDMSKLLCLAMQPDYEERLKNIVAELKKEDYAEKSELGSSIKIMERLSEATRNRQSDTRNEDSLLNIAYSEKHEPLDFNIGDRIRAIVFVERSLNFNDSAREYINSFRAMDKDGGNSFSPIIDKINNIKINPLNNIIPRSDAESRLVGRILKSHDSMKYDRVFPDGAEVKFYSRDDTSLSSEERELIKKIDYLFDTGCQGDHYIERDDKGVYVAENANDIIDAANRYDYETMGINDNYSFGRLSIDAQREHFEAIDYLQRQSEIGRMELSYDKSQPIIQDKDLPKLLYNISLRDKMPFKEETLKNSVVYNEKSVIPQLSMMPYGSRIDVIRPPYSTGTFNISAGDLKTIMENRENLALHGIHYTATYSQGFNTPSLSLKGLTISSVSSLPDNLYIAITRSCSENDFKEISSMRHEGNVYKTVNEAATAYQRYNAEFNRNIEKSPELFKKDVEQLYKYICSISDARDKVSESEDLSEEEKINLYAELEFSRMQLFRLADEDVLDNTRDELFNHFGENLITPEYESYKRVVMREMDELREEELSRDDNITLSDFVKDACERNGIEMSSLSQERVDALYHNEKISFDDHELFIQYLDTIGMVLKLEPNPIYSTDNTFEKPYAIPNENDDRQISSQQQDETFAWRDSEDNGRSDWMSMLEEMKTMIPPEDVLSQDQMEPSFVDIEEAGCAYYEDEYFNSNAQYDPFNDVPDEIKFRDETLSSIID